jgi:hypothetical protein
MSSTGRIELAKLLMRRCAQTRFGCFGVSDIRGELYHKRGGERRAKLEWKPRMHTSSVPDQYCGGWTRIPLGAGRIPEDKMGRGSRGERRGCPIRGPKPERKWVGFQNPPPSPLLVRIIVTVNGFAHECCMDFVRIFRHRRREVKTTNPARSGTNSHKPEVEGRGSSAREVRVGIGVRVRAR